jgi:hypothetical protein
MAYAYCRSPGRSNKDISKFGFQHTPGAPDSLSYGTLVSYRELPALLGPDSERTFFGKWYEMSGADGSSQKALSPQARREAVTAKRDRTTISERRACRLVGISRTLRQRYSSLRVLVLSGNPEERYAPTMIRDGTEG